MSLNIYLIRKCLLPLRNPLTIENIPVFHSFEEAYAYIYKYMETNKLSIKESSSFDSNGRYYLYEDFIGEQFIWIEKHKIKI